MAARHGGNGRRPGRGGGPSEIATAVLVSDAPEAVSGFSGLPWNTVLALYLDAAVDSENTRRSYARAIVRACEWLRIRSLDELTGRQLAGYRAHVLAQPQAPRTKAQRISALRSFLRWSGAMGAHAIPLEVYGLALRTPRAQTLTPMRVLDDDQAIALLEAANSPRERAVVALLLGCGLRRQEVADLTLADVGDDRITVRYGKGMRGRIVPIHDSVAAVLDEYLRTLHPSEHSGGDPMFRTNAGRPATGNWVSALVIRLSTRAFPEMVKPITAHCLRHTFATNVIRGGGDVVRLSKLLGHRSLETTQAYVDHLHIADLAGIVPGLPEARLCS